MTLTLLVVGGNGFIGSAVCKAALLRGFEVVSISTSGRPYQTAKGHTPAWTHKVKWLAASALEPASYASVMHGTYGVVHTLGTLFENTSYKSTLKGSDGLGLARFLLNTWSSSQANANPLKEKEFSTGSYDVINRDSALRVCETFLASSPPAESTSPRPFVYISAEDIFRPIIPERYTTSKREAELGIGRLVNGNPNFRPVYVRPSLVYHAHHRPLTSPAAALLDLSSVIHSRIPTGIPTPSDVLRSLASRFSSGGTNLVSPSPLDAIANAMTIPPIHVDHVAEAIAAVLEPGTNVSLRGVLNVHSMRKVIGWEEKGKHAEVVGSSH